MTGEMFYFFKYNFRFCANCTINISQKVCNLKSNLLNYQVKHVEI